ncbi:MAG: zf-HC2 domain-containing protein [Holophagaceae bacterium]
MTRHVLDLLPLWIGGDLDATDLDAVDRHLAQCPDCRAAAEDLRVSQAWLREALASPFDATDAERLRQGVMAQIPAGARPARRLHLRPALLAAALLVAALVWREHAGTGTPASVQAPHPSVPSAPAASAPSTPLPELTALPPPRTRPRPRSRPASPAPDEPARIEFQTADPTIRIIWLAQARPLPDTAPFPEEP